MPVIRVFNPNCSDRGINVYINLVSIVPMNEKGDNKYVFEVSTPALDKDGNSIDTIYIYETEINGFLKAFPKAIAKLCSEVSWCDKSVDTLEPYIEYYGPVGEEVSLFSSVIVGIVDPFPSNGIDLNSIKMTVNGFDVTDDIIVDGSYNKVRVAWGPDKRTLNG